jgi:hypothetical protein
MEQPKGDLCEASYFESSSRELVAQRRQPMSDLFRRNSGEHRLNNLLVGGRTNSVARYSDDGIVSEASAHQRGGMSQRTKFVSQRDRRKRKNGRYHHMQHRLSGLVLASGVTLNSQELHFCKVDHLASLSFMCFTGREACELHYPHSRIRGFRAVSPCFYPSRE